MAYPGSPDYKDFELASTLKLQADPNHSAAITAIQSLRAARQRQTLANQAAVQAEVDARNAVNLLPEDKRQAFFDEINTCYGIGAAFLENPVTVVSNCVEIDYSDCVD